MGCAIAFHMHNAQPQLYPSRVISAVTLRSHCGLAMLRCAWMAQPHAAFQLAHSDSEKQWRDKKSRDKVEESGHCGVGGWVEPGSEARTQRSLKLTFIRWGKTAAMRDLIFLKVMYYCFTSVSSQKTGQDKLGPHYYKEIRLKREDHYQENHILLGANTWLQGHGFSLSVVSPSRCSEPLIHHLYTHPHLYRRVFSSSHMTWWFKGSTDFTPHNLRLLSFMQGKVSCKSDRIVGNSVIQSAIQSSILYRPLHLLTHYFIRFISVCAACRHLWLSRIMKMR